MNLTQDNINIFLDKYIKFVDEISTEYNYENNIKHLLYIIVPAFVYQYGVTNESFILKCFREIKIYISGNYDEMITATFNRSLKRDKNSFYTEKFIMLNNYKESNVPVLIDNIVHEFNHAVNSVNNEVLWDDKYVKVRTGLSTIIYDKDTLKYIKKSDEISLEEILNTVQTEEIINIINSFSKFSIDNSELSTLLYTLKFEIDENGYKSDAYSYQKHICECLVNNKTFTPTINNLRFKGFIEDIPNLFDNVIGKEGSYKKLNKLLSDMHILIIKYSRRKFFKERLLNKIRSLSNDVRILIEEYDSKCIFK